MRTFRKTWVLALTCDDCGIHGQYEGMEKPWPIMRARGDGWRLGKRDLCSTCKPKPKRKSG